MGMSADEIANEYDLQLMDVYLALAYYHANLEELQKSWKAADEQVEALRNDTSSLL